MLDGKKMMRAIEIDGFGGPEVLSPCEVERPRAGPDEVLIKVLAAGVNRPDCVQRLGLYPPPPGASPIPGLEVSGIVEQAPANCRFAVGDRVCALLAGGGYAEYALAPVAQCLPVPAALDMFEAAGLPETLFTVWSNLFDRAALQAGELLLIHGASGGIGTTAIQIAARMGVRVIAMAGTPDKCRLCESLGAERAVNYREEDFVEVVKTLSQGRGADVILDCIGGDTIGGNIKAAAVDGRIVFIGFMTGSIAEVNFMPLMLKRLTLTGSTLRPRSVAFKGEIASALEARVWPLIEQGLVKTELHRVFPLAQAAEAHRLMESGAHAGKIVLDVEV